MRELLRERRFPFLVAGCLFGLPGLSHAADQETPDAKPDAKPDTKGPAAPSGEAERLLAEYRAFKPPALDPSKRGDREYVQTYIQGMQSFMKEKAGKAKEFADKYPNDPQAQKVMVERWNALGRVGEFQPILQETEKALKDHPDSPQKADILLMRAAAALQSDRGTATEAVGAFIKAEPKDERGGQLLTQMAQTESDPKKSAEINAPDRRAVPGFANGGDGQGLPPPARRGRQAVRFVVRRRHQRQRGFGQGPEGEGRGR